MAGPQFEKQAQEVLGRSFDATRNRVRVIGLDTSYVLDGENELTVKTADIVASSLGATEVVAAVAGKKIRVLGFHYTVNAAVNVKFQSATTDITGLGYHGAQGEGMARDAGFGFLFETAAGAALNINLSGAVAVGGHLTYAEV